MLIISRVCGLRCTNSVLLGNLEESGGKWILDFYWALRIFNCADFPSYPCQYTCILWFWTVGFRYYPLSFLLIRCLHIMVGDMGISAFFSFSLSVLVIHPMRDIEYQHSQKMCIRDGCWTSPDLAAIPCPAGFQSTGVKTVITFISVSLRFDDSGHYADPGLHGSFFIDGMPFWRNGSIIHNVFLWLSWYIGGAIFISRRTCAEWICWSCLPM